MIELHTWKTPNGRKVAILLEELGLAYSVVPVDLSKGEQKSPAFLAINPNGKIPAIVETDGVDGRRVLFDGGAILLHLADEAGRLIARSGPRRLEALEWLFWSATGFAPMLGQWGAFTRADTPVPAAIEKFTEEGVRLFGVLEARLTEVPFLAHDYGIADIQTFAWTQAVLPMFREKAPGRLGPTPATDRWLEEIGARPAVKRGLAVPS